MIKKENSLSVLGVCFEVVSPWNSHRTIGVLSNNNKKYDFIERYRRWSCDRRWGWFTLTAF